MALDPGTSIGPYAIVSPLGAGGMGEVYRARDARLNREVALKVLPATFARDPERLRRFETEARASGQLNHPNILVVYDFGVADGTPYLAAELLEGETLRARLTPPAKLPARKATDIAAQVARGLAAAHARGIVHRDLKPENIFVARDGQVKILDFGLAKVMAAVNADAATLLAAEVTSAGSVLGTAGYMSPEQVRGEPADARSDLFALGAILYEMLAGRRAFHKATAVETMSAILKEEPTLDELDPALQRVVDHCLEKDPAARFQSARDLEFALAAAAGSSTSLKAAALPPPRSHLRRVAFSVVGLIGLVIALFLGFRWGRGATPAAAPSLRLELAPPPGAAYGNGLAISPDGTQLAFVASGGGEQQLWLRRLDTLHAQRLAGTAGAQMPFWSPDSGQIGFFTGNALKTINLATGNVQSLTVVQTFAGRGGAWGAGNTIIFSPGIHMPLEKISASGGTPVAATAFDRARGEVSHRWPAFLPDGRHFIFLAFNGASSGGLDEGSLDSTQVTPVAGLTLNSSTIYSQGYLLYSRQNTLVAQRFDWRKAQVTGPAQPLNVGLTPIGEIGPTGYIQLSASTSGRLLWRASNSLISSLALVNRSGKVLRAIGPPGNYTEPALSPDRRTIAVSELDAATGTNAIWLINVATGAQRRLTLDATDHLWPTWSPDGQWVYFSTNADGGYNIFRKRADGTGGVERTTKASELQQPAQIVQSGAASSLLYTGLGANDSNTQVLLPLAPHARPRTLSSEVNMGVGPRVSPNGRWMAYYASDASGNFQVFVEPFPDVHRGKWQITSQGSHWPAWDPAGGALYFMTGDMLMEARTSADATGVFSAQPAQALFPIHAPEFQGDTGASYSVFPGGQQFLVNELTGAQGASTTAAPPIVLLTHWTNALRH